MAPLATREELASWVQSDVDNASADLALAAASGQVRGFCGWSVSQETVTAVLDGSGSRSIWLPTMRLTDVASVSEAGVSLVYDTDFTWTSLGRLVRVRRWGSVPRSVVVTYTHGWATVPDDVKAVTLAVAARTMGNPQGLRSVQVESVSWTAAGAGGDIGPGLTDGERMALAAYRLPVVV